MSINELRKAALTQMWVIIRNTAKEFGILTKQVSRKEALKMAWASLNINEEKEIYESERAAIWQHTENKAMYLSPVMKAAKYLEEIYVGNFWAAGGINGDLKNIRVYRQSTFKCEKSDYFQINVDDFQALVQHFEQGGDFGTVDYSPNQGLYLDSMKKAKTKYQTWASFFANYVGQRVRQSFAYDTLKTVFDTEL